MNARIDTARSDSVEIKTEILDRVVTIKLSNAVKSGVRSELIGTIGRLLDEGHREFVVNLERVRILDSAGLGDIVQVYTAVRRRGGQVRLEGLNQHVQDTLKRTKLAQLFETRGSSFRDPFNPNLRDSSSKAAMAAAGSLLVIIVIFMWIWGSRFVTH